MKKILKELIFILVCSGIFFAGSCIIDWLYDWEINNLPIIRVITFIISLTCIGAIIYGRCGEKYD